MKARTYYLITGALFTVAALVHMSRVLIGWEMTVADRYIAEPISLFGMLIAGYLAYTAFRLHRHGHAEHHSS